MITKQQKAEEFVRLWLRAKQLGKGELFIAQVLGVNRQAVQFKATRLRALGVKLPPLQNTFSNPLNTDKLNKMIAKASQ